MRNWFPEGANCEHVEEKEEKKKKELDPKIGKMLFKDY
jgi:hypothetical protein